MPVSAARTVRRFLAQVSPAVGDAELLARHLAGDADAFAAIVRRHGPMVLGACGRALGPGPDADDAFQATFLALARHARQVRRRDDLGAWLHRVAVHASSRAHARRARADLGELPDVPGSNTDPLADVSWREVRRLLDEELDRLPARLRGPVVACYLDGQTRDEAARRLGCSPSTLKRRLRRGLHVLRARLTRRGLAPVVVGVAALGGDGLRAVVPDALIGRTVATATGPAAGASATLLALVPNLAPSGLGMPAAALAVLMAGLVTVVCLAPPTRADRPPDPPAPVAIKPPERPPADTGENDPLPAGAAGRFGFPRFRTGAVTRAQVSPDGKFLAVPSRGGLLVWQLASGQFLTRLPLDWRDDQGQNLDVFCFTTDGTMLATVENGRLAAYSVEGTRFVRKAWQTEKGRPASDAIALPRTQRPLGIVSADAPGAIHRVLVRTDAAQPLLADVDHGVLAGAIPWRSRGIDDLTWLLAEYVPFVKGKPGPKFESRTFLSSSRQRAVQLNPKGYSVIDPTSRAYFDLPIPVEELADVSGAMTDAALFLGRADGGIRRVDLGDNRPDGELLGHPTGTVTSLAVTTDGKTLVSLGTDHVIRRWDVGTNTEIPPPDGYTGHVRAAISSDGEWVAAGDAAGRVDAWDVNSRARRTLRLRGPSVSALQWLPDGRSVAAFLEPDAFVVWDAHTGQELRAVALPGRVEPVPADHWFPGVAVSPDGTRAVRVLERGGTWCFDTQTGRALWRHARTGDAAFSPDGATVAVGRPSQGFHLLDAATGRVLRTVPAHFPMTAAADQDVWTFAPDGRALVAGVNDPKALERGFRPARGVAGFPAIAGNGRTVSAVSPDGRWLAIGDESGTVILVETASGKPARTISAHLGPVSQVTFSPDGRRLLSAGRDLTVYLWDLRVPARHEGGTTEQLWERARSGPDFLPAVYALADRPDAADLLRERFRAAAGPPPEEIARAIYHLESERYAVREAAYKRLMGWGPLAEAEMRTALTRGWSAETIVRLEAILDTLPRPRTEEQVAQSRAVLILETIGSPTAKRLLEEWATGADGAWLTEQSRMVLRRWTHK